MGVDLVLAVCGGGGNDTAAMVVIVAIAGLYLLAVATALSRAEDGVERAAFVAVADTMLIPVGIFVLLFAAFGLGTGCLD